ncbi:MAG: 2-C-methyl-D-erythritol 2,4-cyclodiphosphate synthase [Ruminococcaceae bacterium]|nr:2-C-methyl-D-erythritol 2,4-cyclodiphosphate synthase [Oscillospiraceae bacterium]
MRIGLGFDSHRLVEGRKLVLGGVYIQHEKGLLGHSDADVLVHAIIDSLFGACALGDIGSHFSDKDPAYKDIDSMLLLKKTVEIIEENGFTVGNIDATVIIEKPKLAPYILKMRENLAAVLKTDIHNVSVKAKTNEKLGEVGSGNAAEAMCIALVKTK